MWETECFPYLPLHLTHHLTLSLLSPPLHPSHHFTPPSLPTPFPSSPTSLPHKLQKVEDEKRQQMREGEELQHQTEEDADREILSLKNRYERQLRERLEENTRLRGELGIHTKKVRL